MNDPIKIATIIYGLPNVRTKDEILAVASILYRSDDNIILNDIENRVDTERIKEVATVNFATQKNENEYKKILALSLSIKQGRNQVEPYDIFDDGTLEINTENLKKAGKAGKLKLYTVE